MNNKQTNNKQTILAMHALFNPIHIGNVVIRVGTTDKLTIQAVNEEVLYSGPKNAGVYWYETNTDIIKVGKVETKLATKKKDGTFGRGGSSGRLSGTFSDYSKRSTDERTKSHLYTAAINNDCKVYFVPAKNITPKRLEHSIIVAFEWGAGYVKPRGNSKRA